MKRFILLLLSASLFSCSNDNKNGQDINLKMRWDKNHPYSYQNTTEITSTTGLLDNTQSTKKHSSNFITITLIESLGDASSFKLTYDSIVQHRDSTVLWDSTESNLNYLNGKSVVLRMEKGKIKSIGGLDTLLSGVKDTAASVFKELFQPYNLDATWGGLFNFYPSKSVRLGNTWKKETNISIRGLAVTWNNTYLLKEIKDSTVVIETRGKNKDDGSFSMNNVEVPVKISGTEQGLYEVLIRDGSIVTGTSTNNFTISLKLGSLNIPIEMNSKNTIRRLD